MGSRPTAESLSSLGKQRDKLLKSMTSFNADSHKYLGSEAFKECLGLIEELCSTDFESEWDPIDPPFKHPEGAQPETFSIALPSALLPQSSYRPLLNRLMKTELELRKGRANDCLAEMRTSIGQQAYQCKKVLKPALTKTHQTRARLAIQNVHRILILQSRVYNRTRKAMMSLGMELDTLESVYKPLTQGDISVSSAVSNPNVAGSSRMKLSWIWTTHQGIEANDNHLTECEPFTQCYLSLAANQEQSIGSIGFELGPNYTDGKKKSHLQRMKCIGRSIILLFGRGNGFLGNLCTMT
jgi:hypothetical protein